jgi:hypothetical protein
MVRGDLEDLLEAELVALGGLNSKTALDKELVKPTSGRAGVLCDDSFILGSTSDLEACRGSKRRVAVRAGIAVRCSRSFAVSDSF